MLKDFKSFVFKGNIVDIAIGIVVGQAFNQVIQSFVRDILTPFISIPGKANFASLSIRVGGSVFLYGDFLNFLVSFVIISATVFFFVMNPITKLTKIFEKEEADQNKACPFCFSDIPIKATRCPMCTSLLDSDKASI